MRNKIRKNGLFNEIYKAVNKIPGGRVAIYGQIAQMIGVRDARKVGWALHANTDRGNPCHRVVNRDGKLAKNYAFGGWEEQKGELLEEGVEFKNEVHVDLESCRWGGN